MSDIDLVIKGGEIITPSGRFPGAVGIEGGKIAFISNGWTPTAKQTIEMEGKVLVPGFIDTHIHFRDPGRTYKEDFLTGSMSAAAGGFTFVVDMPNTKPPVNTADRFKNKLEAIRNKSIVDFALYGGHGGGAEIDEIPAMLDAGAIGIKLFMIADPTPGGPHDPELFTGDDGVLYDTLKRVKSEGSFCAIHPGNQEIFAHESRKCWAAGTTRPKDFLGAYFGENFVTDDTAISTIVVLASAAKTPTHILHVRSEKGIRIANTAKEAGERISIEVNPKYMLLGEKDMERLGPLVTPYGLSEEQQSILWQGLNTDKVDVLASDHAPHTKEEMEPGWKDIWKVPFGNPQLDHVIPVLLSRINEGYTSLETLIRTYSEMPAKLVGIYPRKGAIQVGSDADLTIIDLNATGTLSDKDVYTKVGWSPYNGWKFKGRPVMTIVRGRVVMSQGKVIGEQGWGQFIPGVRR
jgi:dihydroorotase (multifunctional complex type)